MNKDPKLAIVFPGQGSQTIGMLNNLITIDKKAREIVNKFADTQEQKETHFNAEAEASGTIHLQQRVWNLFGKGEVFSEFNTTCKRPEGGISPIYWDNVMGKKSKKKFKVDEFISLK